MKTFTSVAEVLEDVDRVIKSIEGTCLDLVPEVDVSSHRHTPNNDGVSGSGGNIAQGCPVTPESTKGKKKRPERKKAQAGRPKRPLSAYNIFFKVERNRLLNGQESDLVVDSHVVDQWVSNSRDGERKKRLHRKSHGKIAFEDLARMIAKRWKDLPQESKYPFQQQAEREKLAYMAELDAWQRCKEGSTTCADETKEKIPDSTSFKQSLKTQTVHAEQPEKLESLPDLQHPAKLEPVPTSLNAIMYRGRAYMQYQAMLEQKQAEYQLRQSMLDHMHMMLGYGPEAAPTSEDCIVDYQSDSIGQGYYDMADATFQMAQKTLPLPAHLQQMHSMTHHLHPPSVPYSCFHGHPLRPTQEYGSGQFEAFPCVDAASSGLTHTPLPQLSAVGGTNIAVTGQDEYAFAPSGHSASIPLPATDSICCIVKPSIVALHPPHGGPVPFEFDDGLEFGDDSNSAMWDSKIP